MLRYKIEAENANRVLKSLQGLERKIRNRTVRKATKAAGKVVFKATQTNARQIKQTGFTARSLKQVSKSRRGRTTVRIGQQKQKTFKQRKTTRARGRNLSQIQRAGKPVPIHWLERGTKPHIVRARAGGLLVFKVGRKTKKKSGLAFAKQVSLPGMKPQHLLRRSSRQAQRAAGRVFLTVVRQALAESRRTS